jgi:hypothetical protein
VASACARTQTCRAEQPERPAKALQVVVSRARAELGADVIASTPNRLLAATTTPLVLADGHHRRLDLASPYRCPETAGPNPPSARAHMP